MRHGKISPVQVLDTPLRDVKLIQPRRFGDHRGWFAEVYNQQTFAASALPTRFVQDNQSHSQRGVLRGLHYQLGQPQGKLVRALRGHIWDVAVDLRPDSPDFGRHAAFDLKGPELVEDVRLLWIPEGFAHGFLVLSETADVLYKATDFYHPAGERCIRWDDSTLNIPWPLDGITPAISPKDTAGTPFEAAELPPQGT